MEGGEGDLLPAAAKGGLLDTDADADPAAASKGNDDDLVEKGVALEVEATGAGDDAYRSSTWCECGGLLLRNDEVRLGEACRDEGADLRARAGECDRLRGDGLTVVRIQADEEDEGRAGATVRQPRARAPVRHSTRTREEKTNLSRSLCPAALEVA